jgi:tetratricopeptide (TPR) repeat protein
VDRKGTDARAIRRQTEETQELNQLDKLPLRARLSLGLLNVMEKREKRKEAADSLREAIEYREKAERLTDAQSTQRGLYFLRAGRAFINSGLPYDAVEALEQAQSDLEAYKMQGVEEGFFVLSGLYRNMGYVYGTIGRENDADAILDKKASLDIAISQNFSA